MVVAHLDQRFGRLIRPAAGAVMHPLAQAGEGVAAGQGAVPPAGEMQADECVRRCSVEAAAEQLESLTLGNVLETCADIDIEPREQWWMSAAPLR